MSSTFQSKVCSLCVMDTSYPTIEFDARGQCNCCKEALSRMENEWWTGEEGCRRMNNMVSELREAGRGKSYDAIIGLSGGIDSAYLAHLAVRELGLKVLAIHVDGGWNSEPAVRNIESLVRNLDIDLYTYVVEWQEMQDLQVSFLRAGVQNQDIPQDHLFFSILYKTAISFGIDNFLSGVNYSTESVFAPGFGFPYSDDVHLRAIHRQFGRLSLTTYPVMSFLNFLWIKLIRKQLKVYKPLNFIDYNKSNALELLRRKYNWRDYGHKHSESHFTKFYQDIYLPKKTGFDKRRLHLSSLIVSGQINREEALQELQKPALTPNQVSRDIRFVAKKLDLEPAELKRLIDSPLVPHTHYPNQKFLFKFLERVRQFSRSIRLRNKS